MAQLDGATRLWGKGVFVWILEVGGEDEGNEEEGKLFEAPATEIYLIQWKDFDDELMQRDCFLDLEDANRRWFIPQYGNEGKVVPEKWFVVIRW